MNERYWERFVWVLCDYWWGFLIGILVLGLLSYISWFYWIKPLNNNILLEQTKEISSVENPVFSITTTPSFINTVKPTYTNIPTKSTVNGYINQMGGYALNYSSDWKGSASGANARFDIGNGCNVQILVKNVNPNVLLSELTSSSDPIPIPNYKVTKVVINNEPALRWEIMNKDKYSDIIYYVKHGTRFYILAFYSSLVSDPNFNYELRKAEFENLISSFYFLNADLNN
jgi:hypothetical protein